MNSAARMTVLKVFRGKFATVEWEKHKAESRKQKRLAAPRPRIGAVKGSAGRSEVTITRRGFGR